MFHNFTHSDFIYSQSLNFIADNSDVNVRLYIF